MEDNASLLQMIGQLSRTQETGTLFVTTTENRACHIVVEQGRITALSYGRYRGEQVVEQLTVMPIAKFSFKQGIKMPLAGRSFVDDNYDVVDVLGLALASNDEVPEPPVEAVEKKRVYRGHTVSVTEEQATEPEQPRKKPVRMYRGQPLQDD